MPQGVTREDFVKMQARLYDLYDVILPRFASGQPHNEGQGKGEAAEFRRLFELITERPLAPYYAAVGRNFFSWL
jgi:hypothetical protein